MLPASQSSVPKGVTFFVAGGDPIFVVAGLESVVLERTSCYFNL